MNIQLWAILAVILGISSFVGSIPVNVVTDVPANTEDNVLQEAITDGFIVDNSYFSSVVTEKPQSRNSTGSGQHGDLTTSDGFNTMEGSGTTEGTTDPSFPIYPSPTASLVLPHSTSPSVSLRDGDAGIPNFLDTQGSGSGFGSEESNFIIEKTIITQVQSTNFNKPMSKMDKKNPVTGPEEPIQSKREGRSTPGWMIIVGFVVGVAALVLLCIAIATRDKWNGPNQASLANETKCGSSDQAMAQEMETFLHKEHPEEVKDEEEYTVIPLNELPEKEPLP